MKPSWLRRNRVCLQRRVLRRPFCNSIVYFDGGLPLGSKCLPLHCTGQPAQRRAVAKTGALNSPIVIASNNVFFDYHFILLLCLVITFFLLT